MWVQKVLPYLNKKEKRKAGRQRMNEQAQAGRGRLYYTQTRVEAVQLEHGIEGSPIPSPPPVPSLTLIFFDVPPAGHPAVTPVLELSGRGQNTDGLDVLIVGNRG